ncbi:MAG: PhoH family protein [Elusimicrobiota bacterium]
MINKRLRLNNPKEALDLLGEQDKNARALEQEFGVAIFLNQDARAQGLWIEIRGQAPRVKKAFAAIKEKLLFLRQGSPARAQDGRAADWPRGAVFRSADGKSVSPRTPNQKKYADAIAASDLVFGIGPAGTGKTFLAVACALRELENGGCRRVVVSRPVVEAGEKLGFLPGDLMEKVDPYLRPIYDAFLSLLGPEKWTDLRESGIVEIVPLAYMRGRTFEDAFILLDEAQNATPEQIKMFLTRLGNGSRMTITGDLTQSDLPGRPESSGLSRAIEILKNVEGVSVRRLTDEDVVRHPLVRRIIQAYEAWEKRR